MIAASQMWYLPKQFLAVAVQLLEVDLAGRAFSVVVAAAAVERVAEVVAMTIRQKHQVKCS